MPRFLLSRDGAAVWFLAGIHELLPRWERLVQIRSNQGGVMAEQTEVIQWKYLDDFPGYRFGSHGKCLKVNHGKRMGD